MTNFDVNFTLGKSIKITQNNVFCLSAFDEVFSWQKHDSKITSDINVISNMSKIKRKKSLLFLKKHYWLHV